MTTNEEIPDSALYDIQSTDLELTVLQSAAGFYIGTTHNGLPVSRVSVEYFPSEEAALEAFATNAWTQRPFP